jgi:hypothetical protein
MQQYTAIISQTKLTVFIIEMDCVLWEQETQFFLQEVSCRTLTMAARVPVRAKYLRSAVYKVAMGQVFIRIHAISAPSSLRR